MDSPLLADVSRGDVVLAGRYQLRSRLGSGGMAQVYDGWDTRLARPVAIKLLRPDLAASPDLRLRFELEARAAARLTHPNVVSVYDAGDDNGRSFIVMERLSGESLADRVGRGPLDGSWLRRLAGEVLSALGAAHEAGIVHRDIKPGNVLFGADGRAKVADFGIARVVEPMADGDTAAALTGAGLVVGTPAYLAPERAMGYPATVQSDLYALGVVLYEALTGRKPYEGMTPAAIAAAAVHGAAANPLSLRPDADPHLVAVIGRAMALDPAQRYPSAAEMAADLHRSDPPPTAVMAASPLLAAPGRAATLVDAAAVDATRPGSRRGLIILGLVILGLGALVVAGVALLAARPGSGTSSAAPPVSGSTAATSTTLTTGPSGNPGATSATTVPVAPVSAGGPIAAALDAVARQLARSKSPAGAQLAVGLTNVAAATDSATRASLASSLVDQVVAWYQQGQISSGEYATTTAILHLAGAPQAPPVTGKHPGAGGGGGGAG